MLSLRRNFAWNFVGTATYGAARWLTFIALAKLTSPHDVGLYSLAAAVVLPVFAFANLNLRSLQGTDVQRRFHFADYAGLRLVSSLFGLGVCLVIANVAYPPAARWVIAAAALMQVFEGMTDVFHGAFQQREQMDFVAKSLIVKGPLRLLALAVVTYLTGNLLLGIVAEAIATLLVLVLFDAPCARRLQNLTVPAGTPQDLNSIWPRWHWPTQRTLLRVAMPLGGLVLIASIQAQLPRYFVEHYRGTRELGFFAALAAFTGIIVPIQQALANAALPRLAVYWAENQKTQFRSLFRKLVLVIVVLSGGTLLLVMIGGEILLRVLYGPEYTSYTPLLAWVTAGAGLGYLAASYGTGVTAMREYSIPFRLQLITMFASLPAYVILTKGWGAMGTTWALMGQSGMTFAALAWAIRKRMAR